MLELKQVTSPKFLIHFSQNTKKVLHSISDTNFTTTAQATFKSLNCLAQRANSLKEHTSHCCGVQEKKTAYSNCFSPLKHLAQQLN